MRGQALQHDIKIGDVLIAINNRSVLCYSYREMIKKIVDAERPVLLSFGRITDKYAAQQFYGVDIPRLASFASTIKSESFTTAYMSPEKASMNNFQTQRSKGFIWSVDAESLDFMYNFCASQVFATTVEDLLYPKEKFRYKPLTIGGSVHSNSIKKAGEDPEKNFVYEMFMECLSTLENARSAGTNVVLNIIENKNIFCKLNSNLKGADGQGIFDLNLSMYENCTEQHTNDAITSSTAERNDPENDHNLERTSPLPVETLSTGDGAVIFNEKGLSVSVSSTPDSTRKMGKRRPTFTSIDLNKFSSPRTAKSSPSFRVRPSYVKRYSQYNQQLDSFRSESRRSKLSIVTTIEDVKEDAEEEDVKQDFAVEGTDDALSLHIDAIVEDEDFEDSTVQ